jgi:small subunit ribosomal protein S20
MANHKSAIKKMRQDEVRRLRNKMYRTRLRTVVKSVEVALSEQNADVAKEAFQTAMPVIDKIASKGVIHKNTAARKKSRLAKRINALAASK